MCERVVHVGSVETAPSSRLSGGDASHMLAEMVRIEKCGRLSVGIEIIAIGQLDDVLFDGVLVAVGSSLTCSCFRATDADKGTGQVKKASMGIRAPSRMASNEAAVGVGEVHQGTIRPDRSSPDSLRRGSEWADDCVSVCIGRSR